MHKLKTVLIQFNRSFLPVNLLVSFALLFKSAFLHITVMLVAMFLASKLVVYSGIFGYQWYMANNSWYYYRNAGFSIGRLFTYSCLLDTGLFIITFALIHHLNHAK